MGGKKLVLNLFVSFIYLTLPYSWSSTYLFIYVWYLSIFPFLSIYPYLSSFFYLSYLPIFIFLSIYYIYLYLQKVKIHVSVSAGAESASIQASETLDKERSCSSVEILWIVQKTWRDEGPGCSCDRQQWEDLVSEIMREKVVYWDAFHI